MAFTESVRIAERIWIPGEQCSCHEEYLIEMERKEKATAFVEKMVKEERNGQLRLAV